MPVAIHELQGAVVETRALIAELDTQIPQLRANVMMDAVLERELWLPRAIIANLASLDRFDDVDIVLDELELLTPAGIRAMVDRNNV